MDRNNDGNPSFFRFFSGQGSQRNRECYLPGYQTRANMSLIEFQQILQQPIPSKNPRLEEQSSVTPRGEVRPTNGEESISKKPSDQSQTPHFGFVAVVSDEQSEKKDLKTATSGRDYEKEGSSEKQNGIVLPAKFTYQASADDGKVKGNGRPLKPAMGLVQKCLSEGIGSAKYCDHNTLRFATQNGDAVSSLNSYLKNGSVASTLSPNGLQPDLGQQSRKANKPGIKIWPTGRNWKEHQALSTVVYHSLAAELREERRSHNGMQRIFDLRSQILFLEEQKLKEEKEKLAEDLKEWTKHKNDLLQMEREFMQRRETLNQQGTIGQQEAASQQSLCELLQMELQMRDKILEFMDRLTPSLRAGKPLHPNPKTK